MQNLPHKIYISPNSIDKFERVIGMSGATLKQLIDAAEIDASNDLMGLDLSEVDFGNLDLNGYDLSYSDLSGANLSEVKLGNVRMEMASVSQTIWPENLGTLFEEALLYRLKYNIDYIIDAFKATDSFDYFLES